MILITDGSDTQASSTLQQALTDIGTKKVYTVGLGDEQDKDALKQLGTADYYELSDYSELAQKFEDIQKDIEAYANSFYWLYYKSPKRGDNVHELTLKVPENKNTGDNTMITDTFYSTGFESVKPELAINGVGETMDLYPGTPVNLSAKTYYPDVAPAYKWETTKEELIQIVVDEEKSGETSYVEIKALSGEGGTAQIKVTDTENNLTKYIDVTIHKTEIVFVDYSEDVELMKDETLLLTVDTQYPLNEPSYTWTSQDNNLVSITIDADNENKATIKVLGEKGETCDITVEDTNNNMSQTLTVNIVGRIGEFTDERDGKIYKTVRVGDQVWLGENFAYDTGNHTCKVYNDDDANLAKHGRLYTWHEAKNACPEGWHLPSDEEWKALEMAYGMSVSDADLFGSRGDGSIVTALMKPLEEGGMNLTLSGKSPYFGGIDRDMNSFGYYWSSTWNNEPVIRLVSGSFQRTRSDGSNKHSVRYVKD